MIERRFHINDLEIAEPRGYAGIVQNILRDESTHGIIFEASASDLFFTGPAAEYLINEKRTKGLKAEVVFLAEYKCSGEFKEEIKGKLNFGRAKEVCGTQCGIYLPVEQTNCTMLIKNRYDQKVDLDSTTAFDGVTPLEVYDKLGITIAMPAKELSVGASGTVLPEKDRVNFSIFPESIGSRYYIRPTYGNVINETITNTNLNPSVFAASNDGVSDSVLTPVILLEEDIDCFDGEFTYEFRFKGYMNLVGFGDTAYLKIVKGSLDVGETFPDDLTVLHQYDFPIVDLTVGPFDQSFSGTTTLNIGEGIWGFFEVHQVTLDEAASYVEFDPETSVNITAVRSCPGTEAKVYALNETISRVVEAITNGCLKVKSDLYGRTDSQPYSSSEDGCGSLRVVNSGLQLRNAEDAKLFLSIKDIFEGLNPIDNIGFGVEPDDYRVGFDVLRIEGVEHFYQDNEILSCPLVPNIEFEIDESGHYSTIRVGYEKWQIENTSGLDEFNSTREYRTSLSSVNNQLNIVSKWVTGGYPIEQTRQQSFASTGSADTKFDNDTFLYSVIKTLYSFEIEQGNVTNAANIFSPGSVYNWRLRPYYNLMRWMKSIGASYTNLTDVSNKLFFTSGTGNYLASGEMTSTFCKMENGPKAENASVGAGDFTEDQYTPLWRPEYAKYTYPLSVEQYHNLKQNPYGYISFQCGNGAWLKGFIKGVRWQTTKGEAEFQLKLKWQ